MTYSHTHATSHHSTTISIQSKSSLSSPEQLSQSELQIYRKLKKKTKSPHYLSSEAAENMSASRNADASANQPGQFGSHIERDEPMTTHGVS